MEEKRSVSADVLSKKDLANFNLAMEWHIKHPGEVISVRLVANRWGGNDCSMQLRNHLLPASSPASPESEAEGEQQAVATAPVAAAKVVAAPTAAAAKAAASQCES